MDKIKIELPALEWDKILIILGRQPYVDVVDIVAEIHRQGRNQIQGAGQTATS